MAHDCKTSEPAAGTHSVRVAGSARPLPGMLPPRHTTAIARARHRHRYRHRNRRAGRLGPALHQAGSAVQHPDDRRHRYLGRRRREFWTHPAGHDPGLGRRPVPRRGHVRPYRRRRLRDLLRRAARLARHIPPAQPSKRRDPALRGRRRNVPRTGHRVRRRPSRGTVLPRRAVVPRAGLAPCRQDHCRLRCHDCATRNPALVIAGTATSVLFGLQRRTSGGILAPALTQLTWSLLMLCYLAPLFSEPRQPQLARY